MTTIGRSGPGICSTPRLTPADWFSRRKIQRACELLTIPNIRVKEVANRLSYGDALYFSRVFKRIVGMSPEVYRQRQTKG